MFLIVPDNCDIHGRTAKVYTESYFATRVLQLHRSFVG